MKTSLMMIKAVTSVLLFLVFISTLPIFSSAAPIYGVDGPETLDFDCEGNGPYTGLSNGLIVRWNGQRWKRFARVVPNRTTSCKEATCGRPLGLKFDPNTCDLYIADATFGLMKVGRRGGVARSVVSHVNGRPLMFANNLDIDPLTGVVYFTDSSMIYSRLQWPQIISTTDRTGRLLRYDPRDGSVSVLLGGLAFPNGVALSKDRSFLLVGETTTGLISKFWLSGPRRYTSERLLQLGGRPDNINTNADGNFWVAQNPTLPLPDSMPKGPGLGHPVKIDGLGRILDHVHNTVSVSDVTEFNGRIYLGSVTNTYVDVRP